jgi:hypothetical protein
MSTNQTVFALALLCASLFAFNACSDDSENGGPADAAVDGVPADGAAPADAPAGDGTVTPDGGCTFNVVTITEGITTDTTWTTGTVYLIEAWNMFVEATLTIEPGVVVKFHPDKGPEMLMGDNGTILARGTAANPIVFTSYKDDVHGCDTNGDGDTTTPAAGDWFAVNTNSRSGSVFEHCLFTYGGAGAYGYTLSLEGSRGTVKSSTFAHNRGVKSGCCFYGALNVGSALDGNVIEDNTFFDNVFPLSIDITFSIDDSNTFHNPDQTDQINTNNGIFINTTKNIMAPISWEETEVPVVVNDGDLWVDTSASLTLGNEVVIKFLDGCAIKYDGANLVNHDGSGVYFTSYRDDTRKGDTNGDGETTAPADGDWDGIYNDATSAYETWANITYDNH